jgi:hypothetical protein
MKTILLTAAFLVVTFAETESLYAADDTNALIALDKKWGESVVKGDKTVSEKLLADKVVSVSEKGIEGKQATVANLKAAPAGTVYQSSDDYKVTFLNPDTAIMTHSTKGADEHYSLHVWSKVSGAWQIIATSTTPAEK